MKEITSSLKIVAYEPELKSLTEISELRFFTAKSFSKDKTNLITGEAYQSTIAETIEDVKHTEDHEYVGHTLKLEGCNDGEECQSPTKSFLPNHCHEYRY